MLGKRDAQTKTKALTTLRDTLVPVRKPADLRPAIGQYCYLYGAKLMLDNDRRVRQLATEVLGALIERLTKGTVFHNHMQLLLPPWYLLAMHDIHADTAKGAKRAFVALLPTEEAQTAVLAAHADLLLTNVQSYLALTVESLVDRGLCTPEEADEWYVGLSVVDTHLFTHASYERCVTSALLGARTLLSQPAPPSSIFPTHVNDDSIRQFLTGLAKFTTLTSKNATFSRTSIRHATYVVLTAATTACPDLLQSAIDPKVVLGVVAEKFPANVPAAWTLVLTYLNAFQHVASDDATSNFSWSTILPNVLPKVLAATKHANYGATSSLSNLLPFVSLVPKNVSSTSFYVDLLAALWKSLDSPHVMHGQSQVVTAFVECLSAMWTIFPEHATSRSDAQDSAYVTSFENVITMAWTKALTTTCLPDRSFRVFLDLMTALVPRLTAYSSRQDDGDKCHIPSLAVCLLHRALHAALHRGLAHDASHKRMLDTLRQLVNVASATTTTTGASWTEENVVGRPLLETIRSLVPIGAVYTTALLVWLGHLLDLVGLSTLFPDTMAALATFQQFVAPSFSSIGQDKAPYFRVWKHFAPFAPSVLWTQLLVQWEYRTDVVAWKNEALPQAPPSLLSQWHVFAQTEPSCRQPDDSLSLFATIWNSHWFDTRVMVVLLESSPATPTWADDELGFFTACWGNLQPLVSPATLRQVLTWCRQHRATPKAWSLLESLLPLLVAIDSNDIWLDVIELVDTVVAHLALHSHAMAVWKSTIRTSFVSQWSITYQTMLLDNWVDHLHRLYSSDTSSATPSCSAAQWAVLCAEFVTLDNALSTPYWEKLPLTDSATFPPSYRLLECVAELCHWNHATLLHDANGYVQTRSPDQVYRWLFVDVAFALTWYTVDIDPTVLSEHVGTWIEPYLMLTELLEALGDRPLLVQTLLHVASSLDDDETGWFDTILLSHLDQAPSASTRQRDGPGVPRQLKLWMFEVGLDYLSTDLILASVQDLTDNIPAAFVHVALPRVVQSVLDISHGDDARTETHTAAMASAVQALTQLRLTSVLSWTADPTASLDALTQIAHLLPFMHSFHTASVPVDDDDVVDLVGRRLKAPSSRIPVTEWLVLASFVLASLQLAPSPPPPNLVGVAGQVVLHAFSAKQDVSELVSAKLHGTCVDSIRALRHVHPQFLACRRMLLRLVQALVRHGHNHSSIELARHHRDALAMVGLRTIVDCLQLKPQFHVAFATAPPSESAETGAALDMWSLVEHTYDVEQALTAGLLGLHDLLRFVELDHTDVARVILQVSQGRDLLWHALSETITHPTLQAALYQVLRLTNLAVDLPNVQDVVDVDGEDEAATDVALADLVITPGLRQALAKLHVDSDDGVPSKAKSTGSPPLGRLLVWDLFLRMFPDSSSPLVTSALGAYVAKQKLLHSVLTLCGSFIPTTKVQLTSVEAVDAAFPTLATLGQHKFTDTFVDALAGAVFYKTVVKLPTMVRLEMTVRGSKVSREITTTYLKDECTLEMVIRVPASYPLRSVEVECTKRIGISEERWRRWVLQILKVTTSQDGSLLDAVLLWKSNVDKEFDGVEPCPICFSILNPKTMGLPNLQCRTCSNKYHNSCLYKWFNQSSKNKCPICQQPFC
ncbi:hypothetical protein DYB32_007358 [Aphanomyces invadans]|uniref:E3 ubiquitin-protein ligase listerin n=1 Tax=Aphanomyces invadans TaxID=157072 RepID=A0A418AP52_9STRA|nr:hypothetical protein DYB32_007358 [Aphanomyces invadans]